MQERHAAGAVCAGAALNVPAAQVEHSAGGLLAFLYMPAGQLSPLPVSRHSVEPAKEKEPVGQGRQKSGEPARAALLKVFAGQGVGAGAPAPQ